MKRKTILIGIGIVLILFISAITAIYLHFKPLLEDEEMKEVKSGILGVSCIGKGCHSFSASSTSGFGGVDCRGYQFFYICLSDVEKYCRYFKPFEPREKCICEVKSTTESKDSFKKFCPKNNLCYGNSFEYEFGCTSDLKESCSKVEKGILKATPKEGIMLCDSAESYGVIERYSQCFDPYIYIYINASDEQKKNIFNEGFIDRKNGQGASISNICNLLCTNCNSTLCDKGNLCEYAKYPQGQNS